MSSENTLPVEVANQPIDPIVTETTSKPANIFGPHTRRWVDTRQSALELRYQRQLRESREAQISLEENMGRLMAWTWIPGRDRVECPSIVNIRDPRLLVMDRFPKQKGGRRDRIGLTMYKAYLSRSGYVMYGGPRSIEMFKDFSIRPSNEGRGLCLDAKNEEVFRTALAMDSAMELVARGKLQPNESFSPITTLVGFPQSYRPVTEWRKPMQELIMKIFHPDAPVLDYLMSPGGKVVSVSAIDSNGLRKVEIEGIELIHTKLIPSWLVMNPDATPGNILESGVAIADIPRREVKNIKEITAIYPYHGLEWLEEHLMDGLSENITVEEFTVDKDTKEKTYKQVSWLCIPHIYVRSQIEKAARCFLDMRPHLGRQIYIKDSNEVEDKFVKDDRKMAIGVCRFDRDPLAMDFKFGSSKNGDDCYWAADFSTMPIGAPWLNHCAHRCLDQ